MQKLVFSNSKGGQGKTTLASWAARVASDIIAESNKSTLILDADIEQWSLYGWSKKRPAARDHSKKFRNIVDIDVEKISAVSELQDRVAEAEQSGAYDYCIIDTSGKAEGKTARAALFKSLKPTDIVLIPHQPSGFGNDDTIRFYTNTKAIHDNTWTVKINQSYGGLVADYVQQMFGARDINELDVIIKRTADAGASPFYGLTPAEFKSGGMGAYYERNFCEYLFGDKSGKRLGLLKEIALAYEGDV